MTCLKWLPSKTMTFHLNNTCWVFTCLKWQPSRTLQTNLRLLKVFTYLIWQPSETELCNSVQSSKVLTYLIWQPSETQFDDWLYLDRGLTYLIWQPSETDLLSYYFNFWWLLIQLYLLKLKLSKQKNKHPLITEISVNRDAYFLTMLVSLATRSFWACWIELM